jgi:hypothetical protein
MGNLIKSIATPLAVRLSVFDGDDGIRTLPVGDIDFPDEPGEGGWVGWIKDNLPTLFSWVSKAVGWGLSFSPIVMAFKALGAGFRLIADNIEPMHNFDWNMADEDIDKQFADFQSTLFGMVGGTIGNFAGQIFCTAGAAGAAFGLSQLLEFNEGAAVKILKAGGEEALEELYGNLHALTSQLKTYAQRWVVAQLYKSFRRGVRALVQDPDSNYTRGLEMLFGGETIATWRKWGDKGLKPWSFAKAAEERYDKMGKNWGNFWEEYDEEFRDGCREALYVASSVLDTIAMERDLVLGNHEVLEVYPNRENKDEYYIVSGPSKIIEPEIMQTLRTHQIIETKDVGVTLDGQDLEQVIYTKKTDLNNIMVKIRMFSNQQPPLWKYSKDKSKRFQKTEITIPTVERSKLDWDKIIAAIGGKNGYSYGSYELTGYLIDTKGRNRGKIIVSASTEDEAGDRIEALAELADCKVNSFTRGGQVKRGDQGRLLWIDPIKVYPGDITIINAKKITDKKEGRKEQSGNYKRTSVKLPLYLENKPENWNSEIAALFSND